MTKRHIFITIIWLFILLFSIIPALAEIIVDTAWVRRYDGPSNDQDFAWAIATDGSGNIYVTGWCDGTSYEPGDYATIKYYPNGDTAWVRTYNGPADSYDGAYDVAADGFGNIYVTGYSYDTSTGFDYLSIKYDQVGNELWTRRYDGRIGRAVAVDESGNAYVTGESADDFATIKYYPNGDTAWVRTYDGPANDHEEYPTVTVDGSGNIYVTGVSRGIGTEYDYATIKYYPNGDTAWVRRYDGPVHQDDEARAIAVDDSGNVYVTGGSKGSDFTYDYITIKYYPYGDTAWVRRYSGPGSSYDFATAIAVDDSGNVYVTGYRDWDYATVKYDADGNELWVRPYSVSIEDIPRSIALDASGNAYITGCSGADYCTIMYYPNGDTAWLRRYDGGFAEGIALDDSGNVYVTGYGSGGSSSPDYVTIKYFQALRGDVNRDGLINPADIVYFINYLFRNGAPPDPLVVGDCNCDEVAGPGDIVILINYLFRNGPPPDC